MHTISKSDASCFTCACVEATLDKVVNSSSKDFTSSLSFYCKSRLVTVIVTIFYILSNTSVNVFSKDFTDLLFLNNLLNELINPFWSSSSSDSVNKSLTIDDGISIVVAIGTISGAT